MDNKSEFGRVWLITGAARGLGRALVEQASSGGDVVVAGVRRPGEGPSGPRVHEMLLDVAQPAEQTRVALRRIAAEHGRLDVLVNTVGPGLMGAIEEVGEADARETMEAGFFGALWLTQHAATVMREQGSGHIVQVSSALALHALPTQGLFVAAKRALEGVSEALAAELQEAGVRVTIATLGSVDTDWGASSMRYASPMPAYNQLRQRLYGSPILLQDSQQSSGGLEPAHMAALLWQVVAHPDGRLRVLLGGDAAAIAAAAVDARHHDLMLDPQFTSAYTEYRE